MTDENKKQKRKKVVFFNIAFFHCFILDSQAKDNHSKQGQDDHDDTYRVSCFRDQFLFIE